MLTSTAWWACSVVLVLAVAWVVSQMSQLVSMCFIVYVLKETPFVSAIVCCPWALLISSVSEFTVPPEERYATQLAQLQEMGFFDPQENIRALLATNGNVHAAVERLLGNFGQ